MRAAGAIIALGSLTGLLLAAPASAQDRPIGEPSAWAAEGEDEDVVRYPPTPARYGLIGGGVGMFGVSYGAGAIFAAAFPNTPGIDSLYIPVAGPWIAMGRNECRFNNPDCGAILYVRGVLYALEGIAQLGGLALIGEGIFMTTEAPEAEPETSIQLTPVVSPTMTGFGLSGSF